MALHPNFPTSPYEPLIPEERWVPGDEALRATSYEKLLPPLVANIRREVHDWRESGYKDASPTSIALLRWWFETEHLNPFEDDILGSTPDWLKLHHWHSDPDFQNYLQALTSPSR